MKPVYKALTIAGSDSGGGAGIQADLKTFAAFGVYGTSAITAVTAQNTQRVAKVLALPPAMVAAQIDAVIGDIGADAVKTGMLANAAIVSLVAQKIQEHALTNVIVDPVMIAKGGEPLLSRDAVDALCTRLIPLATLVTPNVPEAERLTGIRGGNAAALRNAAKRIIDMGAQAVVIKGGHRRGETLERAVMEAKRYITGAIRKSFTVGSGHSPVHHFYRLWKG